MVIEHRCNGDFLFSHTTSKEPARNGTVVSPGSIRNKSPELNKELLRALGPSIDPSLDQLTQTRLRAWHGFTPETGVPSPGNQIILSEVFVQQHQVASAIAVAILQLRTDFARRLPFPCHLDRCEAPARVPRNASIAGIVSHDREIMVRMTRRQVLPGTPPSAPRARQKWRLFALKDTAKGRETDSRAVRFLQSMTLRYIGVRPRARPMIPSRLYQLR